MAEQHVAHSAAAERRDGTDEAQAEAVHAAAHAHQCAGHGFSDDRNEVEEVEQHDGEPWWDGARERKGSALELAAGRAFESGHYRKRRVLMKMP